MQPLDLSQLNNLAFGELQKPPELESLTAPPINNAETIDKIEKKRNFVTSEKRKSTGLIIDMEPSKTDSKKYQTVEQNGSPYVSSSQSGTTYYHSSGYSGGPYGYAQQPKQPDVKQKAKTFSKESFETASTKYEKKSTKSWTIFSLQEKTIAAKKRNQRSGKQKISDLRNDNNAAMIYQICAGLGKTLLESLYLLLKGD